MLLRASGPSIFRTGVSPSVTVGRSNGISPGRHDEHARRPGDTAARKDVSKISDPQVERHAALSGQSATAFSSAPGPITPHGLPDSTVFFADRPRREIGLIPSSRFVELWEA